MGARAWVWSGFLACVLTGLSGSAEATTGKAPPALLTTPAPAEVLLPIVVHHDDDGYAQNLAGLSEITRAYENDPSNRYSYCIRTSATYECLSYDRAGELHRQHVTAQAHGTGVAYLQKNGETFLLTNQHVADWPAVTDAAHTVDDVPLGCKKISDSLKIVDDENDDYAPDDIPLTRVVEDVALDAAVVKAKGSLRTMPYRIGHSALLKVGDVVTVQGFPLGAFRAVTQGQVINPVDHDHFGDWEHDDFIIDAALSSGNSGSPVLAISKRTGEYELVGLFHAEYVSGHGLNAVIGIDQLRDLMFTLKRPARDAQADHRPGTELRAEFVAGVSKPEFVPYLTLGGLTVGVHLAGQNLVYEIFSGTFPADARRLALLVDSPSPTAFGQLASLWTADDGQFTAHDPSRLDSEGQARITDLLRRLHEISSTTMRLRALRARASSSRQAQQDLDQELRAASRRSSSDGDLSQAFSDLVERLSGTNQDSLSYEAVYARLNTPVAPPAATSPTGAASSQGIASTVMAAPSPTTTLGPVPPNSR